MQFKETLIKGCFLIKSPIFTDGRGSFTKLYHSNEFLGSGVLLEMQEQFYTVSKKNVLRGMHFQSPPYDHSKLVSCLSGNVLDVVLDLRKNSKTYGQADSFELNSRSGKTVYIPEGVAHGFLSLQDNSGMMYSTSAVHSPENDGGIHWNSFNFEWPIRDPIVSERDKRHPYLDKYLSPFLI